MAIGTYSELQTAIANWAHRTGDTTFTDRVTEIISLAEARLNHLHLLHNYESDESVTLSTGVNYVAIPSGYISPIAFWLVIDSVRTPLRQVLPEQLPYDTANSQPQYWAIDGANIRFDCEAAENYSGKFRMLKSSNLSGSNTTNALLTARPDIYLAACLVEAGRLMGHDKLQQMWEPKLRQAIAELKAADNRSRSGVRLMTDLYVGRRADIESGE